MLSDRVIAPERPRAQFLKQLHAGHPGMTRMKSLARADVHWPVIGSIVEEKVRRCPKCAAKSPVKSLAKTQWSVVLHTLCHSKDSVLTVVDALSEWPEVIMTGRSIRGITAIFSKTICKNATFRCHRIR